MRNKSRVGEKILYTSIAAGMVLNTPFVTQAHFHESSLDPTKVSKKYTLRFGDQGSQIKKLQEELSTNNFYHAKVDGYYGPKTTNAVKRYQEYHSLSADGVANEHTLKRLHLVKIAEKEEEEFITTTLRTGDKGTKVEKLQTYLKEHGYYNENIDGIYGPQTQRAITNFQKLHGLKADGIAGNATLSFLVQSKKDIIDFSRKPPRVVATNKTQSVKQLKVSVNSVSTDSSIISFAKEFIGTPYRWGGESPRGFDCSGFLHYLYIQKKEVKLPRTVNELWNFTVGVPKPSIGDLVFFETYKPGPSHVGIYLGNGKFISAVNDGIQIRELSQPYWEKRYLGSRRIIQDKD